MRSSTTYDYVAVGHVTVDLLEDGRVRQPGGGAFYSALQAARLGRRTLIVTRGNKGELSELLAPHRGELDVHIQPAEQTTVLATSGQGSGRRQRVLTWAGPIAAEPELEASIDTEILHFAPVSRETPVHFDARARFVGLTPQGLVREWGADGEISLGILDVARLPERCDAVVLSRLELPFCESLIETPPWPAAVAVTAGSEPTTVHLSDGARVSARSLVIEEPREDLGAGDVFAAAFFIALADGLAAERAALRGAAAAAVRLSALGPQAVGTEEAVEQRLQRLTR